MPKLAWKAIVARTRSLVSVLQGVPIFICEGPHQRALEPRVKVFAVRVDVTQTLVATRAWHLVVFVLETDRAFGVEGCCPTAFVLRKEVCSCFIHSKGCGI